MDLKSLFSIFEKSGYSYFSGNMSKGQLNVNFSTSYNGRGKSFDLTLNENGLYNFIHTKETQTTKSNISEEDLFKYLIKSHEEYKGIKQTRISKLNVIE